MIGSQYFGQLVFASPRWRVDSIIYPSGVYATGAVGTLSVTADANVLLGGVYATGEVGTVEVNTGVVIFPTGVYATGQVGNITVIGTANIPVAGVAGSGQVGNVTVHTTQPGGISWGGGVTWTDRPANDFIPPERKWLETRDLVGECMECEFKGQGDVEHLSVLGLRGEQDIILSGSCQALTRRASVANQKKMALIALELMDV